jgi:hypothetical protein
MKCRTTSQGATSPTLYATTFSALPRNYPRRRSADDGEGTGLGSNGLGNSFGRLSTRCFAECLDGSWMALKKKGRQDDWKPF